MDEHVSLKGASSITRIVALSTTEKMFSCDVCHMCSFREPSVVYEYLHCVQLKGLSPECVWVCIFKFLAIVHEYWH